MALSIPHASAEAHALSAKYMGRVEPRNSLAARAPVTWPTGRVPPRAELAAVLETPAGRELGSSAVAVFSALWSWANVEGIAWPGVESIARRAHVCKRTVYSALDALERAGLVVRQVPALRARRRYRQTNTYRLATVAALPQVPRAASRTSSASAPRAVPVPVPVPVHAASGTHSPSPSAPPRQPPMRLTAVEPVPVEPVALPVTPSASSSHVVVVAPVPAAAGLSIDPVQVPPWRTNGPGEPDRQNARGGAHARAATAPPGDRLGPPAVAQSVPEAPPAKITSAEPSPPEAPPVPRLTRAERSARNRAAWSKRTRPSATAARVAAPRRAMPYRAPVEQVPDTGPALAALREWRSTLPGIGRETDRESATPAPVPGVRRPDLAQRAPVALQRLLEAFARVPVGQHGGQHGETPAPPDGARHLGAGLDSQTRSQQSGAAAPSGPRAEARPPSLRCPHPRRW